MSSFSHDFTCLFINCHFFLLHIYILIASSKFLLFLLFSSVSPINYSLRDSYRYLQLIPLNFSLYILFCSTAVQQVLQFLVYQCDDFFFVSSSYSRVCQLVKVQLFSELICCLLILYLNATCTSINNIQIKITK